MENRFRPARRKTVPVQVGDKVIGGTAPILIQSMTDTPTRDVEAAAAQVLGLARAGCELVRITIPSVKDCGYLGRIREIVRREGCGIPFCADVHFQPRAAFEALNLVEKVRINPGNFAEPRTAEPEQYSEKEFERGLQRIGDEFAPLVNEAKSRGVCLRIGVNHGSLSARIMYRYGDTVDGMVESALEYLRVCESENFDQVVFSMKSSRPRIMIQAYRLLAARLEKEHKPYPFHLGVTEAGEGEDGRIKSAVGIGSLLLDGIGDTIRVSLTEDPLNEIPVAQDLAGICAPEPSDFPSQERIKENINYYQFRRRESRPVTLGRLVTGGREKIPVGVADPDESPLPGGDRKIEWYTTDKPDLPVEGIVSGYAPAGSTAEPNNHSFVSLTSSQILQGLSPPRSVTEIVVEDMGHLHMLHPETWTAKALLWSVLPGKNPTGRHRYLAAWLKGIDRRDPLVLRGSSDGSSKGNLLAAAQLGGVLADGMGDLIHLSGALRSRDAAELAYTILQAAGARRTRTEYISCPGCGRTLFDLESTARKIRSLTNHLGDVSIAVMGCIVNGPGEMADADFGYVGGAAGKVSLYAGRECVRKNIPEHDAPRALVELIKEKGRWRDPENGNN
ncbi:(E)-4-hydroxy-3-methylbut-2-enyl-diphosphate synthase [Fibrobacterota bacterium]